MNEDLNVKIKKLANHFQNNNFQYVITECKKLLRKNPKNFVLYNLLGLSFQQINEFKNAKDCYLESVKLNSKNIAALNNLGTVYRILENFEIAEKYFLKVLELKPNYINAISNYGNLKKETNDFTVAIELYKRALEIDDNQFIIHHNLALAYLGIGEPELAEKHSLKALEINPKHALSHKMLSTSKKYNEGDNHFKVMLKELEDKNVNINSKIILNFALSKAYEDIKNYERAYKHMHLGNKLKRSTVKFDIKNEIELFNNLKAFFKEFKFDLHKPKIISNDKIIFICGMPRSGTTLTEQIIASHKEVYGAGELNYLSKTIRKNFFNNNKLNHGNFDEHIVENENIISNEYFSFLKSHSFKEKVITDKAPLNFRWIGFLKIFFPNSKVIHCKRDRKDNFLSLYKNYFDSDNLNWCYENTELLAYFNLYSDLMNFWKLKIPNFIYEAEYEELVDNQEIESKKIINFCELKWDPNCLNFYKNKKTPIKTASIVQARKPIYKSSVKLSEKYNAYFDDIFKELNNF
jgi:Flp pilus assembly protein TadD